MAGFGANATCPHCGMTQNAGNVAQHVVVCPSNPDVRPLVLAALVDPENPTHAVSGPRYNAQRGDSGAPSENTLSEFYGGTWANVCAAFGLEKPLSYQAQRARRAQNAEVFDVTCPHCGNGVDRDNLTRHERACVRNPAVREAVLCCLRDPQNHAHATSAERYNARRVMYGAPSDRALVMQYDGKWETVYRDFGLDRPLVYSRQMTTVTCSHCAQEFASGKHPMHVALCPKDPAHYDAIRAALQDADYPEFALALIDYHERARAAGVAGVDLLKHTFGGWRAAVEYFDLQPANSDELLQRRAMQDVLATAAWEAHLLREDAERANGLFIGDDDPRKPNYKPPIVRALPGVTVNGHKCVAVMLR